MMGGRMAEQRGTLADQVAQLVRRDGVVTEALARGIVNQRALARWIRRQIETEASEEAVLSSLRRLGREAAKDPFADARQILGRAHLNVRSRICQFILPRSKELQERLSSVLQEIDFEKAQILYYTQGETVLKILVDESNRESVSKAMGPSKETVVDNLAAISVVQPQEGLNVPGILSLMTQTLALLGVNVIDAMYGFPEYIFFVNQEQTIKAYEALDTLLRTCRLGS